MSDSATPWTTAHQASLSITNSQSLPEFMSIESVMPSNHLILCHPLLLLPSIFSSIRVFSMSQFFTFGGQSIKVSASALVLPMNFQDWFPLGMTEGLIMCGPETHVISYHLNSTFGFIAFQLQEELILDDIYTSSCRITDLMVSSPKMVMLLRVTFAFLMHFH